MDEVWELLRGEDARRYRRAFSRVGWAMAALVVLQVACQYLLQYLTILIDPKLLRDSLWLSLLAVVSTYAAAFPAALLILRPLPVLPMEEEGRPLTGRQGAGLWLMALGWLYLSNLLTLVLMNTLSAVRSTPIPNPLESAMGAQPVLFNLIVGCMLAPVAEELCFRRVLIDRLWPLGKGFAVCASALLFALIHCNLYQMLYAFTVGFLLGWVYLYTRQVRWTILLHAGLNLVSAGLIPLAGLLGSAGDWLVSLLVLAAMAQAIGWTLKRWKRLTGYARGAGWGSGEIWGHFVVNPGMTACALSIVAVVWLIMFRP